MTDVTGVRETEGTSGLGGTSEGQWTPRDRSGGLGERIVGVRRELPSLGL